jgi:DNA-binding MarR family transcriptional regulator
MGYSQLATEFLDKTGRMMKSSFWPKRANAFLHGEMFILNYLVFQQDDALPSELAAAMNASTARVAMALKSLESKCFIARRSDANDRRKVNVSITAKGRELVENERKDMHDRIVALLNQLGEEDAREYIRLAERITEISERIFGPRD